ncbi:enoyl-CoA hydratase [Stemphylium lycopersici]|uniref:Enoyl-CoA hydratase n=1 Tax=Stemphylium lycopersici TaxID=183478 RepID=A0A364MSA6_STELY|nr:enoyl-CoA hydratase [Stemphylium lycopersici]RAQ98809.1 enoyl-CoA hydratase [Stemphylium lycopersici]RAR01668.1 enoyl-CoA hydratase [Stemphylium lycopersici]
MASKWLMIKAMALVIPSILALDLPQYRALKTAASNNVLEVTIHNPDSSINTWNQDIQSGLTDLVQRLGSDNETRVVIFKSDVSRFFLNHLDPAIFFVDKAVDNFAALMYNISTLNQITIAAVEGRARAAGNELLMAMDMRFATTKDVFLGQVENAFGTFPGGGGSQQLHRLIGKGRAMEYIITSKDISAKEAERIGWINKAFDSSEDMYAHIAEITERITLFPRDGIVAAKKAINLRANPTRADFTNDVNLFNGILLMQNFTPIFTRYFELTNNGSLSELELNFGRDATLLYK